MNSGGRYVLQFLNHISAIVLVVNTPSYIHLSPVEQATFKIIPTHYKTDFTKI